MCNNLRGIVNIATSQLEVTAWGAGLRLCPYSANSLSHRASSKSLCEELYPPHQHARRRPTPPCTEVGPWPALRSGWSRELEQPQAVTPVPHPRGLPRLPLHPTGMVLSRLLMSKAFSDRDKLPVFPPKNSCASSGLRGRPIDS